MDAAENSANSVTIETLHGRLAAPTQPVVVDVRRAEAFDASERTIAGALRGDPGEIEQWAPALPTAHDIVVYCVHGHQVSQGAAEALRRRGFAATYLIGGFEDWHAAGRPTRSKRRRLRSPTEPPARWVTRERPKIDRIACPWLIRRFVDPQAEILFVPSTEVIGTAERTGAVPFDVPDVEFSHEGERCSFDAFLDIFGLDDPALHDLAVIVRGADTGRLDLAPQAPGLLALSLGLSALFSDDQEMLDHGMVMYDALYVWLRVARSETHGWPPAG